MKQTLTKLLSAQQKQHGSVTIWLVLGSWGLLFLFGWWGWILILLKWNGRPLWKFDLSGRIGCWNECTVESVQRGHGEVPLLPASVCRDVRSLTAHRIHIRSFEESESGSDSVSPITLHLLWSSLSGCKLFENLKVKGWQVWSRPPPHQIETVRWQCNFQRGNLARPWLP